MKVIKQYYKVPSTDGIHMLNTVVWRPENISEIKGIVQISHGMCEFMERYDEFAYVLAKEGYIVGGHDHLGHGKSVNNKEEWGYFAKDNASSMLVNDIHEVTKKLKKEYPHKKLFLIGHSMGSFLARRYLMTYPEELTAAIVMGSGSQPPVVLGFGQVVIKVYKLLFSEKHRSNIVEFLMFGKYNKKFSKNRNTMEWITKDNAIRKWYLNEPACTFKFTLNGYQLILDTLGYIQKTKIIARIPKNLPILLTSGQDDPVGNYGKGVKKIYKNYKKAGIKEVTLKLYPHDRHEILNEIDRKKVYQDILNWLSRW